MKQAKQLVPELRFPEFDGEWKQDSLNKLANVNPRTRKLPDEFIYIDLESVTEGKLVKEETVFADEAPSRAQRVLDKGDILYQTVRPYQKNNYFFNKDGDYVASTGYAQIKAKYYSKYLFQFLHNQKFVNIVNRWSTGTSYPAISPSELVKIKINYPTAPEQQKIADFLSQVDKKIDLLRQKLDHLKQYKKGVMQKLFSQELRFKRGLSGVEGQDDGSDYPDWEEKKLLNFCTFFSGGTPKSTNNEYYSGDIPFIGSGDIYDSAVNSFISEEALNSSSAKLVEKGDLLYALYGANSGELFISKINGAINQAILCIRSKSNILYLYYLLLFNQGRIVSKYLQGGQGNLSSKIIKNLKYEFPSKDEQTKIANYLSAIDQKISFTQQQLEQTQTFKKGLLQKMFV